MIRAAIRLACDLTILLAEAIYDAVTDPIEIPEPPHTDDPRWHPEPL